MTTPKRGRAMLFAVLPSVGLAIVAALVTMNWTHQDDLHLHAAESMIESDEMVMELVDSLTVLRGNDFLHLETTILAIPKARKLLKDALGNPKSDLSWRNRLALEYLALQARGDQSGSQVRGLIQSARAWGPSGAENRVPSLKIEKGIRKLGPSAVPEAAMLICSRIDSVEVLAGVIRGLALVEEGNDPRIDSLICFCVDEEVDETLKLEALQSAALRDLPCSKGVATAFDLLMKQQNPEVRIQLASFIGRFSGDHADVQRLQSLMEEETDELVIASFSKASWSISERTSQDIEAKQQSCPALK